MTINIFYLDDEESLCDIFTEILSSEQIKITTFTNENKAIAACQQTPPDLFFIDYRLPSMTGSDVAFAVDPSIEKILVTGDLSVNCKYHFKRIISKPYKFDFMANLIDEYIIQLHLKHSIK
jgi:DNA-binding NtrC family response regulator